MAGNEKIIKYTIMPKNDEDDYTQNFKLSIREFAKSLEDKTLVAPLIIYNSDLDIPLDMEKEIEKYVFYTDKDGLATLIKKQETTDYFRCLILHGFDISLDEIRDIYCPLSRKNEADVCINVVQELDYEGLSFKENLTFYLRNDLDNCTDEEWEEDKKALKEDMDGYINEWLAYDDLLEEDMMELIPYLMTGNFDKFDEIMEKKKKKKPEIKNDDNGKVLYIPLPEELKKGEKPEMKPIEETNEEEEFNRSITCLYECDKLIALTKIDDDLFLIEDDNYEIEVDLDQMQFLIESFNRIKDKPVDK